MQGLKVDSLKDELEKLMGERLLHPTHDVLKNNLEETLEEKKNDECNETAKETGHDKLAAQRHKSTKLKKQYVFSEVIENLHQGLPTSGPISNASSRKQTEIKGENSVNTSETSFGNVTKTWQDSSIHSEGHTSTVSVEKKKALMKELFGPNSILKDSHQNLEEMDKGKKTWQSESVCEISSYLNDSMECGDWKQTKIKVFHATATLEEPR